MKNFNITVKKKHSTEVIDQFTQEAENRFTARMYAISRFRKENKAHDKEEIDVMATETGSNTVKQDKSLWQYI